MKNPEPVVWFDFEFAFGGGAPPIHITIPDGQWTVKVAPDGTKIFHFRHEDGRVEEIEVSPLAFAYRRTVRREEPPASSVEDGGRTRVVGSVN